MASSLTFEQLVDSTKVANDIEKKTLATWTTFFERLAKNPISDDGDRSRFLGMVRKLDRDLEAVTFIGGGESFTALDLFLFANLHKALFFKLTREEYNEVPCITRWYDHIQYVVRNVTGLHHMHIELDPVAPKEKKAKPAAASASSAAANDNSNNNNNNNDDKAKEAKGGKKKEATPAATAAGGGGGGGGEDLEGLFAQLDLRIGLVEQVDVHPQADRMYVEKIALGDNSGNAHRTVVSGLRGRIGEEELRGARVFVVCNLKPRALKGVESAGMVLCCTHGQDEVALVRLERDEAQVAPGTQVTLEGRPAPKARPEVLNPKKKVWETAAPHLKVVEMDGKFVATYNGIPLVANGIRLVSKAAGIIG